ncbi:hypothetical protein [Hufsiella ginkgonis]|uniref:Ada DNA repair metal-binding domain-containing protein n=1 Tax=Hufsiella ginkgonis TaxID=2695274 RepID=A0A7K1XTZ9_9SPHI|nr:hypothetical protein [Hufsiella ginkgonis]MXV14288.1 hypothetical protein [Hufsiella ginkgonis]
MSTSEPNKWKISFFTAIAVVGVLLYVVLSPWKMDVGWKAAPAPAAAGETPAATGTPEPLETTVYVTRTGKRFHRGNCGYLKSKISLSRANALLNGYTPCKICNP